MVRTRRGLVRRGPAPPVGTRGRHARGVHVLVGLEAEGSSSLWILSSCHCGHGRGFGVLERFGLFEFLDGVRLSGDRPRFAVGRRRGTSRGGLHHTHVLAGLFLRSSALLVVGGVFHTGELGPVRTAATHFLERRRIEVREFVLMTTFVGFVVDETLGILYKCTVLSRQYTKRIR